MRQKIPAPPTLPIALEGRAIFSAGLNAIAHLDDVAGSGPFTILAPTDEAFASLSTEALNELIYESQPLTELIRTHLVRGARHSRDLAGEGWLLTVGGVYLAVDAFGAVTLIDGAQVLRADLQLWCGIAHVIDRVLQK